MSYFSASNIIFDLLFFKAPLVLFLLIEIFGSYVIVAQGLFNCDILYGGCKGTFFSSTFLGSPVAQPYPQMLAVLFFVLIVLSILIPLSTVFLIFTKSKKIAVLKVILYLILFTAINFYRNIYSELPSLRLKCDWLRCESFEEAEQRLAVDKNLTVYQPKYLPESIKNLQKVQRKGYPHQVAYGTNMTITEAEASELDDCSVAKDKFITGASCEVIVRDDFEARYIYKTTPGKTVTFLVWNKENTQIILSYSFDPQPIEQQIIIARSFE